MRKRTNPYLIQKRNQLQKEIFQLQQFSKELLQQYQNAKMSGGLVFFSTNDEQKISSTYQVLNNTFPILKSQAKDLWIQLDTSEKIIRRAYNPKNSFPNKRILNLSTIRSLKKRLNEIIQSCEFCLKGTHNSADISMLSINFNCAKTSPQDLSIPNSNMKTIQKDKQSFQNHFGLNSNYSGILLNAHLLMSSIQKSKSTLRTLNKL